MNILKKFRTSLIGGVAIVAVITSAGAANITTTPEMSTEYITQQLSKLDFSAMPEWRKNAVVEASNYAYMDLDAAKSIDQKEKILQARETIIYSQGWGADGLGGYLSDSEGNVIKELPAFYDLFPTDWSIPTVSTEKSASNSEGDIMPYSWQIDLYQEDVILKKPSSETNSDPFHEMATSGFVGTSAEYHVSAIRTLGTHAVTPMAGYYNVGYSNAKTGESYGWLPDILSGTSYTKNVKDNVTVAIRASSYSHPGTWLMTVWGDR